MFSNPCLRPADSVLLFITRELRGELIWDRSSSFYLTFSYLAVAVVIFCFFNLCVLSRVRQAEEVLPALPSCPAQVVRHLLMSPALALVLLLSVCFLLHIVRSSLKQKKRIKVLFLPRFD